MKRGYLCRTCFQWVLIGWLHRHDDKQREIAA